MQHRAWRLNSCPPVHGSTYRRLFWDGFFVWTSVPVDVRMSLGKNGRLPNAPRSTRMAALNQSEQSVSQSGENMKTRTIVMTVVVPGGMGSVLRQRRRPYGHLEAERGQIEDRSWGSQEHNGCLRGGRGQRESDGGWSRPRL